MKATITLFICACAVSLAIAETIVRLFNLAPPVTDDIRPWRFVDNKKIIYEFVPGSRIDNSTINQQGFKDRDFVLQKPPNVVRIAMLGDSITQGAFLPSEKTFSKQLERLLNQRAADSGSVTRHEVMNFGVGGYNLEAEVETLKTKVLLYSPDIVVLNMFFNDDQPIPGISQFFSRTAPIAKQQVVVVKRPALSPAAKISSAVNALLQRSRLYFFLMARFHNLRREPWIFLRAKGRDPGRDYYGIGVIARGFSEIEQLRRQYGFKFLVCIHSSLLYHEDPNDREFAELAKEFHFACFRIIDYYRKEAKSADDLRVETQPTDTCHPNEFGHAIIARAMYQELKAHHFID